MRKLLLAVLLVASMSLTAEAAVQNIKLSGSIESTFIYRENFDLEADQAAPNSRQSSFITQSILRADADLTDKVAAVLALINERGWGSSNTSGSDTDLTIQQAYVVIREILGSNADVTIGRQQRRYGNGMIVDFEGTNNSAPGSSGIQSIAGDLTKETAMDAIVVELDFSPLKLDLVAAVVDENNSNADHNSDDNVYLFGANANYSLGDDMNSVVETYFWAKKDLEKDQGTLGKAETIKVIGIRFETNPLEGVNTSLEYAFQGGNRHNTAASPDDEQDRKAHAVQFIGNYQVPKDLLPESLEEYNPMITYVFGKFTGDSGGNGVDQEYTAWDPFFEGQAGGKIYNALFNQSNYVLHEIALTVTPLEDLTLRTSVTKLWTERDYLASSLSLVQPDNGSASPSTRSGKNGVGVEIDVDAWYDYTEDVQFGLSLGIFKPGAIFDHESSDRNVAKQILASVNVDF